MYNYDELEGEEQDLKENFRITRCCGNCKFFWYYMGNQRKGNCTINDPEARNPHKTKIGMTDKNNRTKWPPVHITCVCDKHQMTSRVHSLAKVTDYCGAEFEPEI